MTQPQGRNGGDYVDSAKADQPHVGPCLHWQVWAIPTTAMGQGGPETSARALGVAEVADLTTRGDRAMRECGNGRGRFDLGRTELRSHYAAGVLETSLLYKTEKPPTQDMAQMSELLRAQEAIRKAGQRKRRSGKERSRKYLWGRREAVLTLIMTLNTGSGSGVRICERPFFPMLGRGFRTPEQHGR